MPAIVLSKKDFREFDQITVLYTKEQGKVELLSRGIKKMVSKQAAFLIPFSLVEIEMVPGKEIDHLIRTQSLDLFKNMRSHLHKSLMANYVVTLVDELTHVQEKDERVFELLVAWLGFLDQADKAYDSLLLSFISKFLALLGFKPELKRCVVGGETVVATPPNPLLVRGGGLLSLSSGGEQGGQWFSPSAGGVICASCKLQAQKEALLFLNWKDVADFQMLYSDEWQSITELSPSEVLKNSIYQFLTYQTERKAVNWFEFMKALA